MYIYVCICIHIYICIYIHVYVYIYVYMYIYIYKYIVSYIHIYTNYIYACRITYAREYMQIEQAYTYTLCLSLSLPLHIYISQQIVEHLHAILPLFYPAKHL